MYGDLAMKLAQDARRVQTLESLPAYQVDLVASIVREIRDLNRDFNILLKKQGPDYDPRRHGEASCALFILQLCVQRNKRSLLAYHRLRAKRIEELAWAGVDAASAGEENSGSGNANSSSGAGGTRGSTSLTAGWHPDEDEYFRGFSDVLAELKGEWTDIDLVGPMDPPRDLFIDVRVLKDAGDIQTEYGMISLTRNSQFYVRQADVERLIQQGYLLKMS
ncbi:DNA replication complex GINS protein psf1 [Myxozyma melibiosi]|uniref:DNA replication complex GINS protein PSF1 n=1 Tax=Myxozyma melibiosi TaxID=54550 RepID=A0ABR1F413_9ASCO